MIFLSPNTAKIFYEARQIQKDYGIQFVWQKKGNVFMKKNESDSTLKICSLDELNELRKCLGTPLNPPRILPPSNDTHSSLTDPSYIGTNTSTLNSQTPPVPLSNESYQTIPTSNTCQNTRETSTVNQEMEIDQSAGSATPGLLPPPEKTGGKIKTWAMLMSEGKATRTTYLAERNPKKKINQAALLHTEKRRKRVRYIDNTKRIFKYVIGMWKGSKICIK